MPTWPSTLPDVLRDPSHETPSSVQRTTWASGRSLQRPIFTSEIKIVNVRWLMKAAQYRTFLTFHRHTINNGADAFTIDLPFGNGLEQVSARFVQGVYRAGYQEPHFVITAALEVSEVPTLDEATFDFYIGLGADLGEIEASTDHLHRLVHTTFPALF